jgi:rubrerythrin
MESTTNETALIARLNDLLQLDHDAVAAYSLALENLEHEGYREVIRRYRGDHERHIQELTGLIRGLGGVPMEMPHLTGAFKLGMQAVAGAGSDRSVLMAFRTNERQVRDKYRRAVGGDLPEDVAAVVARAAADESRHYDWAVSVLEQLGVRPGSLVDRAGRAAEVASKAVADTTEGVERAAMYAVEGSRRVARKAGPAGLIGTALAVVGAGVLVREALRRR